ncbi:DUF1643 domain-containing protein [Maribacter flavus]|uniref:DUF1643 domain-containing protein n=1 Tax=Maribacter flavus TaxID=1658664 RepID=A0A5B2TUQ8_9FLAO|nr:DUF1643 domain-containing protein [Maribacter flavus]KAA2218276.1 DUF1643 domain-containing protein [Maribacter flavus]
MLDIKTPSGALFSRDKKYRYALWRVWDTEAPSVMFIGLNPSTANENENDPTIRKVIKYAKDWGFGGVIMCNLFTYVSAYPEDLIHCKDSLEENIKVLNSAEWYCSHVVFAWGNFKIAEERAKKMKELFPHAMCLVKNKNGSPRHPLYVKSKIKLIPYSR